MYIRFASGSRFPCECTYGRVYVGFFLYVVFSRKLSQFNFRITSNSYRKPRKESSWRELWQMYAVYYFFDWFQKLHIKVIKGYVFYWENIHFSPIQRFLYVPLILIKPITKSLIHIILRNSKWHVTNLEMKTPRNIDIDVNEERGRCKICLPKKCASINSILLMRWSYAVEFLTYRDAS